MNVQIGYASGLVAGGSTMCSPFPAGTVVAPLFQGLPDDRCQCPHWGYVIKGELRYRFASHEVAGDVSRTRAMRADGGLVLQLKPASFTPHFVRCDEVVFERFLDVLRLAEWREQTVIGEEFRAR